MLKINPVARPDCAGLISKIEKLGKVPQNTKVDAPVNVSSHNLLGTIAIPKDLRNLENVLPESKYEHPQLLRRNDRPYIVDESKNNSSGKYI